MLLVEALRGESDRSQVRTKIELKVPILQSGALHADYDSCSV